MSQIFAIMVLIVGRIFCNREPILPELVTEQITESEAEIVTEIDNEYEELIYCIEKERNIMNFPDLM